MMPPLPSVTIVIEWENAIDLDDDWAGGAMAALDRELAATASAWPAPPVVSYLFDRHQVDVDRIRSVVARAAPHLARHARLEFVPTEGLSYYELKNFGADRASTDVTIFLDSDAAPEPGWLRRMLEPFADDAIVAVGGITVLGHVDLLSRTMALVWIFGLREEREATATRWGIYANNTAVRTAFFRTRPFPALEAFKYQCVFWLRDVLAGGGGYRRVADAVTVHAPHPGFGSVLRRAWAQGRDRDFFVYHLRSRRRVERVARAAWFFGKRTSRAWWRIAAKHRSVGLPLWQTPAAAAIALVFNAVLFAGQAGCALSRRYQELPPGLRTGGGAGVPARRSPRPGRASRA